MSPLARSLLALACAALLHASNAADDVIQRVNAELPYWNTVDPAMGILHQGILDNKHATKHRLRPYIVHPNNEIDFFSYVPYVAKHNEALIGQKLWVLGEAKKIILKPETGGKHAPIHVHCEPRCKDGVVVVPDQYVIPKLL